MKSGISNEWEYGYERFAIFHMEYDWRISRFKTQPITFRFEVDGKYVEYTSDIYAEFRGRCELSPIFIQVKPYYKTILEEFKEHKEILTQLLRAKGIRYGVMTEHEIFAEPAFSNIKELRKFRQYPVTSEIKERIISCVAYHQDMPIGSIQSVIGLSVQETFQAVKHLLAVNLLFFELYTAPLTIDSKVFL